MRQSIRNILIFSRTAIGGEGICLQILVELIEGSRGLGKEEGREKKLQLSLESVYTHG